MSDLQTPCAPASPPLDTVPSAEVDWEALGIEGEIPDTCEIIGPANLIVPAVAAMRSVYDPEIPVNIFDLGLVYKLDIRADGTTDVIMTLTAPGCPVAEEMPEMVSSALDPVEGLKDVRVRITWDPPWHMGCMTEEARMALGMFY